jgi:DNA-binding HxlR family transcriptional regulator
MICLTSILKEEAKKDGEKKILEPLIRIDIKNWRYIIEYSKDQFNCPVEATLFLIGKKYKPLILWYLIEKLLHYMELQRMIPKATPKMLSQQLHNLEESGMLHREVIPDKPTSIAYSKFIWKITSQVHPFCMSNDILPDVR